MLRDVSLDLYPGELHVLAGENGAGKSTLMKILAGVYAEYSGHFQVNGTPAHFSSVHDAAAAGISIIHQELSLVGSLSVAENIFLGREYCRAGWLDHRKMVLQAEKQLQEMGLDVDASKPAEEYPVGIQQMIEICKAVSLNSRIIVMDEPTSALTRPEAEKLFALIDHLKAKGCGIIYISHKMDEIYRLADRITVLRDGRYVGTETADRLPHDKLVNWMVGRDIEHQAPRAEIKKGREILRVKDLQVDMPGEKQAVKGVSFSVKAGEILGIAGLQGSGNSELLNGIFGTYGDAASGDVVVDGEKAERFSPADSMKLGISLLTNDRKETGLVLGQSILSNAALASLKKFSPWGWMRPGRERKSVSRNCRQLKLKAASLDQNVETLSGGNQQKVVIAKWVQTQPKVFLLDEPTRGIDIGAKHETYRLLNDWTSKGMAIVLITSEMPELIAMSDRILVMHQGRIVEEFGKGQASQEKILNAAMGERSNP